MPRNKLAAGMPGGDLRMTGRPVTNGFRQGFQ